MRPTETSSSFYARRVERTLAFIEAHLDEALPVARLAEVAGLSKFHFHRQFRAHVGAPVARFVARLRLRRAAQQLAFSPELRVLDVALSAGFDSPEAFARAFRAVQGQSPTAFRRAPDWPRWHAQFELPRVLHHNHAAMSDAATPILRTLDPIPVAALEHRGPPATLMASVQRFIAWRRGSQAAPEPSTRTLGVLYDDPESVAPEDFRFDVCAELARSLDDDAQAREAGVVAKTIAGGRYAVARHRGSTDAIGETVMGLYRDWLPGSGERVRDAPLVFHYIERVPRVAEHEQVTDVYLPLV